MAASALWPVQQLIYGTLNGNAPLKAVVSRIYDMAVPETASPTYPYIVVGEKMETAENRLGGIGRSVAVTIHIWSNYRGSKQIGEIMEMVQSLLENRSLALTLSGWHLNAITLELSEILEDSVDLQHGILRFRVRLQPA